MNVVISTQGDVNALIASEFLALVSIVDESPADLVVRAHDRSLCDSQRSVFADFEALGWQNGTLQRSYSSERESIEEISIVRDREQVEDDLPCFLAWDEAQIIDVDAARLADTAVDNTRQLD
jgi:hypothetical protein